MIPTPTWQFQSFDSQSGPNSTHHQILLGTSRDFFDQPCTSSRDLRHKSHDCWRKEIQRQVSTGKPHFCNSCPLQLLAVHFSHTVIHDLSQLFVHCLSPSKMGPGAPKKKKNHKDVGKFKRHREHFVRHGLIAACLREVQKFCRRCIEYQIPCCLKCCTYATCSPYCSPRRSPESTFPEGTPH